MTTSAALNTLNQQMQQARPKGQEAPAAVTEAVTLLVRAFERNELGDPEAELLYHAIEHYALREDRAVRPQYYLIASAAGRAMTRRQVGNWFAPAAA